VVSGDHPAVPAVPAGVANVLDEHVGEGLSVVLPAGRQASEPEVREVGIG
jgi:hypothetical protein